MAKPLTQQPWVVLSIGAFIILALLFTLVEIDFDPERDPRPVGTADDIESLANRDDVNVLFILVDTLRADRLGAYGYHRDTSPNLDILAQQGVRFSKHLSQSSWTKCSMASLWTGLYPKRSGVMRFDDILSENAVMPAEVLKEAGFRTVGLYRNGWVSSNFGFSQGFDVYDRAANRPPRPSVRAENPTLSLRGTDEGVVESALEFLRVHGHERWFLYLHLMDIHEYTYDQHTALFGTGYSDIYDNSIRWVDRVIDLLLDHMAAEGHTKNTIVVVTSDHGEAFRERGLEGHARAVYRETTEVPFILSFPFRLESGVVLEARTRNVDVWPTLLDILGLSHEGPSDGVSLRPQLLASARGLPVPESSPVTSFAYLDQRWGQRGDTSWPGLAVVDGGYRYVKSMFNGRASEELFDAARDPAELSDIAAVETERTERMRAIAEEHLALDPVWGETETREIGEMELNQLRALGYSLPQ